MKKLAFSVLEIVFVIIVIGILAINAIPHSDPNLLEHASEQVANHIRYTQHLAIIDDKFLATDQHWYKKRWQIRFLSNSGTYYYDVFSDMNTEGNSNANEEAVDPLSKRHLGSGHTFNTPTDAVDLTHRYGITGIGGTCVVNGTHKIGFDYMGRPYLGVSAGVYNNPVPAGGCTITLNHPTEGTATITVAAETGYVSISY